MFRLFRRDRENGAAAVEFAIVLPLFILLVFGTMEAGWLFAQLNDIHHGAREGARLAAVDADSVADTTCSRMGLAPNPKVVITAVDDNDGGTGDGFIGWGDTAHITVTFNYSSLTGVLDGIFDGKTLTSEADFRLEQPLDTGATWYGASGVNKDCS